MTTAADAELLKAADELREADSYKAAIVKYQSLLERGVDTPDVHFGIGQCYGKSYDFDAALPHLRKAFEADPARADANYYAYVLERHGLYDEAGEWYQRALDADPEGKDLWGRSHYCWFLEKAGRNDEARRAYEDFLAAHPTYTWAVKRYALLLRRLGEREPAEDAVRAAVDRAPASPFPALNYLEFLVLDGRDADYESFLATLDLDAFPPVARVTVSLFDYFRMHLLPGKPDASAKARLEAEIASLDGSVHRDFDDLTELLMERGGDVDEWRLLLQRLLK